MSVPPLEQLAQLMEASAPIVHARWLQGRADFATAYDERLALFHRNRERFAARWQEETLLFVPFDGWDRETINAMTIAVSREIRDRLPDERQWKRVLGGFIRKSAALNTISYSLCHGAIHNCMHDYLSRLLCEISEAFSTKEALLENLTRAHWVMLRGELRRWVPQTAKAVMEEWKPTTVIEIDKQLAKNEMYGVKALRMVYDWDLKTALDAWRSQSSRADRADDEQG